jgi:DNA-binding response OmpR family regulator
MTAADGEAGLEIASAYSLGAIVLDIGLPRLDGYGVIRNLRARGCATPVLMLTARDSEDEIICGLDLGADDYLTKPFAFPELIARLQSIMRPFRQEEIAVLSAGRISMDTIRRQVTRDNLGIDLTRHEYRLLECLMRSAGECVPRAQIMECIWGAHHEVGSSALDVLVNGLRAKIDAPFQDRHIGTVRGSGYVFLLDGNQAGRGD